MTIVASVGCSGIDGSDMAGFIDHPERFKGETLTFLLSPYELGYKQEGSGSIGLTLRDHIGQEVHFYGFAHGTSDRLDVMVTIPTGIDVPNARIGDYLNITFVCHDGTFKAGNVATSIARK